MNCREPEDDLIPVLRELDIALVAYSPLGRGILSGRFQSVDDLAPVDWRRHNPRFQNETFAANLALDEQLQRIAKEKRCAPAQLALAWLLRRSRDVVPISGTSSTARLEENIRAVEIELDEPDFQRIEDALPKVSATPRR